MNIELGAQDGSECIEKREIVIVIVEAATVTKGVAILCVNFVFMITIYKLIIAKKANRDKQSTTYLHPYRFCPH